MNCRLLIIEDDPIQQKLYTLLCARFGFECTIFSASQDACKFLREANDAPHLVLTDWVLKGESGLTCIAVIKETARQRGWQVPVVAVTANALDSDRKRCIEAGAHGYLAKPFTLEQFRNTVDLWSGKNAESGVA